MTSEIFDQESKDMGFTKVQSLAKFRDDCLESEGSFSMQRADTKPYGLVESFGECALNGVNGVEMQRAFNRKKSPSGSYNEENFGVLKVSLEGKVDLAIIGGISRFVGNNEYAGLHMVDPVTGIRTETIAVDAIPLNFVDKRMNPKNWGMEFSGTSVGRAEVRFGLPKACTVRAYLPDRGLEARIKIPDPDFKGEYPYNEAIATLTIDCLDD